MKKIGIITLNGYDNHGGRLQNYALEYVIKSQGYNVSTILLQPNNDSKKISLKSFQHKLKELGFIELLKYLFFRTFLKLTQTFKKSKEYKRRKLFKEFSLNFINETEPTITTDDNLKSLNANYDKFIVGSDQVWNPNLRKNLRNEYSLKFAEKGKKNSYAASFSVEKLSFHNIEYFSNALEDFSNISVREFSDLKLLDSLKLEKSFFALDPTLLLDFNHWNKFKPQTIKIPGRNYVLVNVLGKKTRKIKDYIKELKNDRLVIEISSKYSKFYTINPIDFINLIKYSDFIVTDSFHTSVFSFIFNKKFTVFSRGIMESRIKTLYKIIYKKNISKFDMIEFKNYIPAEENKYFQSLKSDSYAYLDKVLRY